MGATWNDRYPQEREPLDTHDFRDDGRPFEKHYPASDWRRWEDNQQPERTPGLGRR